MYLLDANIFLEVALDQRLAEECEKLLRDIESSTAEAVISDFHLDTILIIMEHYNSSPSDMRRFISSLLGFRGLRIYTLSLSDRLKATGYMEKLCLDYDDALAYQTMKRCKIDVIISYDKHFNNLPDIQRKEPQQVI